MKIAVAAVTIPEMPDEFAADGFAAPMPGGFEEIVELGPEDVMEEDSLPLVVDARVVERPSALVPAVQAAAAAATGFVAGAVALALVRRHNTRRLAGTRRRALAGAAEGLSVLGGRTYLVHVRVLGRPPE